MSRRTLSARQRIFAASRLRLLLPVALLLLAPAASAVHVEYSITDLGPGTAFDINNSGLVVGDEFYWDPISGRQEVQFGLRGINDPRECERFVGVSPPRW